MTSSQTWKNWCQISCTLKELSSNEMAEFIGVLDDEVKIIKWPSSLHSLPLPSPTSSGYTQQNSCTKNKIWSRFPCMSWQKVLWYCFCLSNCHELPQPCIQALQYNPSTSRISIEEKTWKGRENGISEGSWQSLPITYWQNNGNTASYSCTPTSYTKGSSWHIPPSTKLHRNQSKINPTLRFISLDRLLDSKLEANPTLISQIHNLQKPHQINHNPDLDPERMCLHEGCKIQCWLCYVTYPEPRWGNDKSCSICMQL